MITDASSSQGRPMIPSQIQDLAGDNSDVIISESRPVFIFLYNVLFLQQLSVLDRSRLTDASQFSTGSFVSTSRRPSSKEISTIRNKRWGNNARARVFPSVSLVLRGERDRRPCRRDIGYFIGATASSMGRIAPTRRTRPPKYLILLARGTRSLDQSTGTNRCTSDSA
jgi:hypothetical protein